MENFIGEKTSKTNSTHNKQATLQYRYIQRLKTSDTILQQCLKGKCPLNHKINMDDDSTELLLKIQPKKNKMVQMTVNTTPEVI